MNFQHGNFIKEDIAAFDAPLFSLQANEINCMDSSQRWLMETAHEALENGNTHKCGNGFTQALTLLCQPQSRFHKSMTQKLLCSLALPFGIMVR
jgi:hypothetical protein